jgi:hypothetical protein
MRTTLILFLALGIAFCTVDAQSQQAGGVLGGSVGAPVQRLADGTRMIQVVGEPYSATTESERVQTLADGTHISRKMMTLKTYRDSQGRTREERYVQMGVGGGNQDVLSNILIRDPVAGTSFSLNPNSHIAQVPVLMRPPIPQQSANTAAQLRQEPPQQSVPPTAQPQPARRAAEPPQHEDLGTQTIEGLRVEGTRTTQTIPTGQQGNDQPIKIVREVWFSKELQLAVLTKMSSPLSGEQTIRMTNISRDEPAPTLFQIPPDYTLVQQ